jgi:fibronectin type 3 domain-containing protein
MSTRAQLAVAGSVVFIGLASVAAAAVPDVPVDLTVTAVSGTSATFTWAGTAAEFRAIYKADSLPVSPTDGTLVFEGPAAASPPNAATATGLAVNTRYFIAVYGKNAGEATYSTSAVSTSIITTSTRLILSDGAAPPWDRRGSPTRGGRFVYATNGGDLNYFNGTDTQAIQPKGAFTLDPNTVVVLGTAASPAQFIAGWRRGTDDAYLSVDGAAPVTISAANPVNPGTAMNCEFITIDQGYVFAVFRAPVGASEVRNAFVINTTTGSATNISSNTTTYGVIHMSSSGNKAAWAFDDGTAQLKLKYYNGISATTIDSNIFGDPSIAQGRIVYSKYVAPARTEIFLYDTNLASPAPVQLTNDATKTNDSPFTDGRHAAWIRRLANGTLPEIVLNGQVQITSGNFALLDNAADPPFQLDNGQIVWRDNTGALHHFTPAADTIVDPSTSSSTAIPWFADGRIVFYDTTAPPVGIYLYSGDAPAADLTAPMTLKATTAGTSVTLKWDAILGATSYNVYYAVQPGLSKEGYVFLSNGTRITGITGNTQTINSLAANSPYYFIVTAVDTSGEGAESREAGAVTIGTPSWTSVGGLAGIEVASIAADRSVPNTLYAAAGNFGGTYTTSISTNTGATWTVLGGGIQTQEVRALAADNGRVFASTRSGPVFRSLNSGGAWTNVLPPNTTSGQFTQGMAIDPSEPDTIVIGDITLPTFGGTGNDSNVIRTDNGGTTWFHTPQGSDSLATYSLGFDPSHSSTLYLGGNGTPNVAKSIAGGAGWTNVTLAPGSIYAIAVDPRNTKILYAGFQQPSGSRGVWKSVNGGTSWTHTTLTTAAVRALIVDPADSNVIHAATETGYYYSLDAGATWTLLNSGLLIPNSRFIQTLAMAGNHRLLAGTYDGIYLLDLNSLFAEIPTPASTTATATGTTQVTIGWTSVAAAASYDVYRRADSTGYAKITTVTGSTQYVDNGVLADHAYLYRVVAVNGTARSGGSPADLATTIIFNSNPLQVNTTVVKFLHLDELRRGANALRVLAGLSPFVFTTTGSTQTVIRANQLTEVRTALDPALNLIHRPSGGYTNVLGNTVKIKAVHVQEMRDRLK